MVLANLRLVAICGGVFALGSAGYFTQKIQGGFRNAEYYKKATRMLRMYRPAVENFGEPMRTKNIDLGDKNNVVDGYIAKMTIPVYGPKGKGTLFLQASRPDVNTGWEIDQLELAIDNTKQKGIFYRRRNPDENTENKVNESDTNKTESETESDELVTSAS